MKIIQLVYSNSGGAARAALRINESINSRKKMDDDVESFVIVGKKYFDDSCTQSLLDTKGKKMLLALDNQLNKLLIKKYNVSSIFSHCKFGLDISTNNMIKSCDAINLHWVNGGVISYRTLKKLKKLDKPIIWTMHDMWAFTGGCHYDEYCGKYIDKCGNCKVLNSSKYNDLSTKIQKKKLEIYKDMNLTIVGCSSWITECAKKSMVFKDKKCINIPNAIDIEKYRPMNKDIAKSILNINTDKTIVLFGAMSSTSDERKGFKYLLEAIKNLDSNKYIAVIFGNDKRNDEIEKYLDTIYFGQLFDDYSLMLLYNCADVFVAPSKQENLANTVMESLACGTPVVAFNIGGMSDMIKHEYNGYLAEPFDTEDLANGIEKCVVNNCEMSKNAREYVLNNFTYKIVGQKYRKLYNTIIDLNI